MSHLFPDLERGKILALKLLVHQAHLVPDGVSHFHGRTEAVAVEVRSRNVGRRSDIREEQFHLNKKLHFLEQMFCKEYCPCIANFIFKTKPFQENGGFIKFPLAMGSDDATTLLMSANGVANMQTTTFDFRLSGINISYHKEESVEIKLKKIEAANMFCDWMEKFKKSIPVGTPQNKELLSQINKGIDFYLYCCTSSYIFGLDYGNFIKEYKFILQHHLFPNRKIMLKVYLKWWKNFVKRFYKKRIL